MCLGISTLVLTQNAWSAAPSQPNQDNTLHVHAFDFPVSSYLSAKTRAALNGLDTFDKALSASFETCLGSDKVPRADIMATIRPCQIEAFYKTAFYKRLRQRFDDVTLVSQKIGGVATEVFLPARGIARDNQHRVLINLHGGGFQGGSRTVSQVESMPIASVGQIKVISVDYRMAPEYTFPAASEDVVAVYRELLKTYSADHIGIYGCSAGGLLTAEIIAWLHKEGLPLPGAVGIFCSGGGYWTEGDSGTLDAALGGTASETSRQNPYFRATDSADPLAFPVRSEALLAIFPPTLIVTSTRDLALSSAVYLHSRLIEQGVDAHLHVWEGLGHQFFADPDVPESREVYAVIARFFDQYLGRPGSAALTPPVPRAPE